MKKITVVIPCKNEEKGIGKVIDGINIKEIKSLGFETEIVVVDNNCIDRTSEIAKSCGARVITEKKQGKAYALHTGFKNAKGEIIVTIDGDNTYPSHEIPKLLKEFDGCDLVIGTRFNPIWDFRHIATPCELPFPRVIANKVGAEMASIILGYRMTDVTTGLRAFRKSLLTKIPKIKAKGLDFEAELSSRVISNKLDYKEVKISSNMREGISSLNYFVDAFRFLLAIVRGKYF